MRALGKYMMRGRLQAATAIALLSLLSWLLPPLAFLMSGAPVALVTLRRGPVLSAQILIMSLFLLAGISTLAGIDLTFAGVFVLAIWTPVWFCALVLRSTQSQGLMVVAAGLAGVVLIAAMYRSLDNVHEWWRGWAELWLDQHAPADAVAQYRQVVDVVAPMLNALLASAFVISLILTVIIGRWWQALLFNPGAFRGEFYALRIPRLLVLPTAVGIILLLIDPALASTWVRDLLVVIVFLYLFQGVAIVHRTVAGRGMSMVWLVAMYGLLLLLPQMVLLLSCLGMADSLLVRAGHDGGNGRH